MRVTPSLPKEGEAAQGEHPLTPPLFGMLSSTVLGAILMGECPGGGGAKHQMCWSPQERLAFS